MCKPQTVVNEVSTGDQPWVSPYSKWTAEDWKSREFPSVAELKGVIPKHCFKRSALKGFAYIARDIALTIGGFYLFRYLGFSAELPETAAEYPSWLAGWFVYMIVEGGLSGGLWVMGHECGHHAFSEYNWLSDLTGWVLHSFFLVPYFSWQFSHAKHHRRTNDLVEGETHNPDLLDDTLCQFRYKVFQAIGETAFAYFDIFGHLFLYFPIYFFTNYSGGRKTASKEPMPKGAWVDHYRPNSPLFPPKMATKVVLADLGIFIMLAILYKLSLDHGFLTVFLWYGLPNIGMNHVFLVYVTWLQHTHHSIPHLGESEWTWVKGALVGTVDRPHKLIDFFGHYISSTHVCHHLFHEIPFYNAIEATEALKNYLEPKGMYNCDPSRQFPVLYNVAKNCHFVENLDGVQYYKSFSSLKSKKLE